MRQTKLIHFWWNMMKINKMSSKELRGLMDWVLSRNWLCALSEAECALSCSELSQTLPDFCSKCCWWNVAIFCAPHTDKYTPWIITQTNMDLQLLRHRFIPSACRPACLLSCPARLLSRPALLSCSTHYLSGPVHRLSCPAHPFFLACH